MQHGPSISDHTEEKGRISSYFATRDKKLSAQSLQGCQFYQPLSNKISNGTVTVARGTATLVVTPQPSTAKLRDALDGGTENIKPLATRNDANDGSGPARGPAQIFRGLCAYFNGRQV